MHVFAAGYVMFVNSVAINVSTFVVFKYEIKHEVGITRNKKNFQQFVLSFFYLIEEWVRSGACVAYFHRMHAVPASLPTKPTYIYQ